MEVAGNEELVGKEPGASEGGKILALGRKSRLEFNSGCGHEERDERRNKSREKFGMGRGGSCHS